MRRDLKTPSGRTVTVKGKTEGTCEVHDWATDGLARRLYQKMHDRRDSTRGVDVCPDCIERAKRDADRKRKAGAP